LARADRDIAALGSKPRQAAACRPAAGRHAGEPRRAYSREMAREPQPLRAGWLAAAATASWLAGRHCRCELARGQGRGRGGGERRWLGSWRLRELDVGAKGRSGGCAYGEKNSGLGAPDRRARWLGAVRARQLGFGGGARCARWAARARSWAVGRTRWAAGWDARWLGCLGLFPFLFLSLPFYSYSNLNIVFESKIQIYLMSFN
jgi:hypothetical protein